MRFLMDASPFTTVGRESLGSCTRELVLALDFRTDVGVAGAVGGSSSREVLVDCEV